jgi:hypothetical protein
MCGCLWAFDDRRRRLGCRERGSQLEDTAPCSSLERSEDSHRWHDTSSDARQTFYEAAQQHSTECEAAQKQTPVKYQSSGSDSQ